MRIRALLIALLVASTGVVRTSAILDRPSAIDARAIDALFAAWDSKGSPGCALGVFQNGAIAYSRGYGMADLEHDVSIAGDTVFYVGSISKQFTAMSAALAMQQGKLAYDDPIRKYLPELPAYADAITVRNLLHHTSGLRDYNTLLAIAGRRDEDAWNNAVVLKMTARQKALNFTPGNEYLYSNTGYTLLATVVERATGWKFAEFADGKIFKPLGMTVSHYHVDATRLVPHRALAYEGRDGKWTLNTPINERAGAGGLYTNIPDLQKWDENFYAGTVGGSEVLKRIQTVGALNSGKPLEYAWGLEVRSYRGLSVVEHGGSLGGYRAHLLRFPSQHTTVALLCNLGTIQPDTLGRRVADVVLGDRFSQPAPPPPSQRVASAPPTVVPSNRPPPGDYVGTYDSDELETTVVVTADAKDIYVQRESDPQPIVLIPEPKTDEFFDLRGMAVKFQRGADGRMNGFTVDAGRVRGITFVRRR